MQNIVSDSFNEDLENVCSHGIHYFKTIDGSFYYQKFPFSNYSGIWKHWNDDGQLLDECNFENSMMNGSCKE
jgi:antitoxin component YwqK of YwqJK toxin-antitoxin module